MNEPRPRKLPALVGQRSPATISPLQLYLQEIAKYPLLEPEEELELAKRHFEDGDINAAHRLITANLRLVVKIANDFRKAQTDLLDLIQEGNYGLMQGVKKFNPYKGVKLSSYAAWWIRAYILKYLMDNKSQVKLATTASQRKLFYNLQKETERLLLEYDQVDAKMLAASLSVSEKDVLEMQKRLHSSDVSLDTPVRRKNEEQATRRRDFLSDESPLSDIESFLAKEQVEGIFHRSLAEFKAQLSPRDLEIFEKRVLSETPMTLQEVGDKFGFTRERARQIESRLIERLKRFVQDQGTLDV